MACTYGATAGCGWSVGSTVISVAAGYGASRLDDLLALQGHGQFMQSVMSEMVDYGVQGVFHVYNDELAAHQYGIVL